MSALLSLHGVGEIRSRQSHGELYADRDLVVVDFAGKVILELTFHGDGKTPPEIVNLDGESK